MPPIKSLTRSSAKWTRQSSAAQPEYTIGVQNPRTPWAAATAGANASYKTGIQAAIAADRFLKGVNAAGDARWSANALRKGPARWAEGIAGAATDYERGFAPYRQVIENTTLPPRGPKGSPQNILRVAAMATALHNAKLAAVK